MSFGGLYTVRSGLDAARRALDIVGQNVANANTAGYSRQEVSFVSAEPAHVIRAPGRGISEVQVLRYRDEFLDRQFRSRSGMLGYYDAFSAKMAQVEQVVGDLSEGGLRTALEQFFNSWDYLASHPSDTAARVNVINAAQAFLGMARSSFQELAQLRTDVDETLRDKVADVNSAAQQVAKLNEAIMSQQASRQPANDLLDQRDRLLDSLARLAGTTNVTHNDGSVTVYLGSLLLVDRQTAYPVDFTTAVEPDADPDPALVSLQQNMSVFTWNGIVTPPPFTSGEVAGLLTVRDQSIPEYMKYLDNLVRTLATEVNTIHMADDANGVPMPSPVALFTAPDGTSPLGSGWMEIAVNPAVLADPGLLVAGNTLVGTPPTAPAASDGERALKIARLRDQAILTGAPVGNRPVTPGEYLRSVSSTLGLAVQGAQRQYDGASMQVAQVDRHRQSVSGVSLDDEMTKMIQFQQAYNAAARVMTTLDEMLDVIVNRVGVVGR